MVSRTGLPAELSGLWGEDDDSDEEYDDEDDEDSNGASICSCDRLFH